MKHRWEILKCRWIAAVLASLVFALASVPAGAASTSETRNWDKLRGLVSDSVQTQTIMWTLVETNCEKFLRDYPNSEFGPDVLAIEARALFNQQKYDAITAKFSIPPTNTTRVADQFAYWMARASFEKKNYGAAAEEFARLSRDFSASKLRLEAMYREGEANAQLNEWQRVIEELGEANGVFQQLARANPNDEWVVGGQLLLGHAKLVRKDFAGAKKTVAAIAPQPLRPELEWQRQYLLCQAQLGDGDARGALVTSTNLLAAAAGKADWKARSFILKGQIYESLEQWPEAIQTYEENLNAELQPERRREALLSIVELVLRQNKTEEATQQLTNYLAKYPGENGSDFEWLMLGELRLKQHFLSGETISTNMPAPGQGTNLLLQAQDYFTKITTNSEYFGKAQLDLGWCFALEGKILESLDAFSNAVARLPFSEDQAVARFKLADTLYAQTNLAGALENYTAIIEQYGPLPAVRNGLFEQALYQIIRVGLAQTNVAAASSAMTEILDWFPTGLLADRSMLLVGQAESPAAARKVFSDFISRWPQSPLLPEVKLAIARTYEKETNWADALARYNEWTSAYSNNPALPRAEFSRAWCTYQAGNESNAFLLFTNFVARNQSNALAASLDLPARAQYWVGDYFWRQGEFQKAQISYKEVFQKWPSSALAGHSRMQAGRAAVAGQRPQDATNYFASLATDQGSPPELRAQAAFAMGDAVMATSPTNARSYFYDIATTYTNSSIAPRAWGRLGDCNFGMAAKEISHDASEEDYKSAEGDYSKAMKSEYADVSTRSLAELALGKALEARARLQPASEQTNLFVEALDHFFNVIERTNLRDSEQPDWFYVKEAGLEAAKLSEDLGYWKQGRQIYEKLGTLLPPLQSLMEKKIERTRTLESTLPEKK